MSTSLTTLKVRFNNAEQFAESFSEPEPATIGYVFIGHHLPWDDENSVPSITDTKLTEKDAWDNMYAAKKITGNDVEFVIPRRNWSANVKYHAYDDTLTKEDLLTANVSQSLYPMYVYTTERNVYKCLSNNSSANSTVEPTGDYSTANGVITTADGYIWKYMYNVKPGNKFLTTNWIPIPRSVSQLDYGSDASNVIDGELVSIIVTNSGSGYYHGNVNVSSFVTGCTNLTFSNSTTVLSTFSVPTIANLTNMVVAGTGIRTGTYITAVDVINGRITLSTGAIANGGSSPITLTTRVSLSGDGTGAEGTVYVDGAGNVSNVIISTIGTGYTYANAVIYGSGTGATARPILPPKFGHGYNSAKELSATNVMVSTRIGEIDSTENGLISVDTSFRQYGLMKDPYKYGSTSVANTSTANAVISQTTNITVTPGSSYTLDEYVYQGTPANPTAYGYVNAQSANQIRLTKVKGTFVTGSNMIGETSGVSRTAIIVATPEFQPYSGDILHIENVPKIDREDGQAEDIKFVLSF